MVIRILKYYYQYIILLITVLAGWSIYLNTGNALEESIQGLMFYRPFDVTVLGPILFLQPKLLDLDNDGKSEIVNSVSTFLPQQSALYKLVCSKL
jgi:hypothetical protein